MSALFIILVSMLGFGVLVVSSKMRRNSNILHNFAEPTRVKEWRFEPEDAGLLPGRRNIALRGSKPFHVLIGVRLQFLGHSFIKWYGCSHTNCRNEVVFHAYLSRGNCNFYFLFNTEATDIVVSSTEQDQCIIPWGSYPLVWWQKLGFFK